MQRRNMFGLVGGLALSTLAVRARAATQPANATGQAPDPGRWSAFNLSEIARLLRDVRSDATERPYAVFDWDNTCIMNDCEEALFAYQIEQLAYRMSPDEFVAALRQGVPAGPLGKDYHTEDGRPVAYDDLVADLDADYRWLHANAAVLAGSRTLEDLRGTAQFEDFRVKMMFAYDALCDSHPLEVGYTWIIRLFTHFSRSELAQLAEAAIDQGLGDALRKVRHKSPASLPGRSGVVSAGHFYGLRIHTEMASLMHTLRSQGIEVFVSTASLDDVVRVFAGHAKYGYQVPPENVIGLRLEMDGERYTAQYRKGWHFNWGPGKTVGIQNTLVAARGHGPCLVLGDSDGDAWMLKDFADTRLGIIVNRLKKGPIGERSRDAASAIGKSPARYVLQGRNEQTGLFMPDERSLKFGSTEPRLLA